MKVPPDPWLGVMGTVVVWVPLVMVTEPCRSVVPKVVLAVVDPGGGFVVAPMAVTTRMGNVAVAFLPETVFPLESTYDESENETVWLIQLP